MIRRNIIRTGNFAALLACAGWFAASFAFAGEYAVQMLVEEAPLHGANGMDFNADGELIAGSMMSGSVFKVDTETGDVELIVGPPQGIADDLAIGPDGTLAWTSTPFGIVHVLRPGGEVERLARNLPMINSIYFTRDGRLFAAQVTEDLGNLYEIDMDGEQEPRIVVSGLQGLNSFEITADDMLYGPLMWGGKIIRIDLRDGTVTDVADGFDRPVAVNFDSTGKLYAVDYLSGEISRVDPDTGMKQVVATVNPPIDNLAIDSKDSIYISQPCRNGISRIDADSGSVLQVSQGSLGLPGGAVMMEWEGRKQLLVAGMLCQNLIDTETGEVTPMPRQGDTIWSGSIDYRDGQFVISSFAFGQVQWLDADTGKPLRTIAGFDSPYAVRMLANGDVLLAEYGSGRVLRLHASDEADPEIVLDGLEGPVDLIYSAPNMLYISEADAGRVSRYDIASGDRVLIADELEQPEGIALHIDGRLLIAEVGARRLLAVDLDSGVREVIADDLPVGMPPIMGTAKAFLPTGVATDQNGNIYVVSDIEHNVLKISPQD